MKILILDALTQTVDIDKPFTSGVIRSALNDAYGMAYGGYEVTYAYFGKKRDDLPFKTYSFGPKGLKDRTWENTKLSGQVMNQEKEMIFNKLTNLDFDVMLIHLHSYSSYINDICKLFEDIPKVFMVHDFILDVFTSSNMMKKMVEAKKFRNVRILSNSDFTKYLGNYIYKKRYDKIQTLKEELVGLDINDQNKFIDRGWNHFVFTTLKEPIGYENGGYSINIGRYDADKRTSRLLRMHNYQQHKVKLYGSYDPYHDPEATYYGRIQRISKENPSHYEMCEAYSDEQLKEDAKNANNVVITCEHEGFGYTAYEMGLLGIPAIVIADKKFDLRHATSDYLQTANVPYRKVAVNDYEGLYNEMANFKLTLSQKKDVSKAFIEYFTLENFVQDRLNAWDEARNHKPHTKTKALF